MRTDDLIRVLTEDHAARPRPAPLARAFTLAFAIGLVATAGLFGAGLGLRPDFATALASSWRLVFKFVATLALAAVAAPLVLRSARPAGRVGWAGVGLAVWPLLLAAASVAELQGAPRSAWAAHAIGVNGIACVISVTVLSIAPLACALYSLKRGAPVSPGLTGALAGILSSALAAALYGAHCTDDSPLFVAIWYTLGFAIVTLSGALIGARVLRW